MKIRLVSFLAGMMGAASLFGQSATPAPAPAPEAVSKTEAPASAPQTVSVGIYMASLDDIDPSMGSFLADFYVWTNQKAGDFDPLASVVFPGTRRQETLFQSLREVNGVQWSLRRYRGTFLHDWNLQNFPFDKHQLRVQLRDSEHHNRDVRFVPDIAASGLDRNFDTPGWRISDFRVAVDDVHYKTTFGDPGATSADQTFSWITATVTMERDALWLFLKLLTGAYLAFAAAMFACLMKTTQPPVFAGRMGLQIGCLFTAMINNRATDSILGRDDQFALPDLLHLIIYFMIFLAMVITLRSRVLNERDQEEAARKFERRATLALVAVFIIANIILICRAALSPVIPGC